MKNWKLWRAMTADVMKGDGTEEEEGEEEDIKRRMSMLILDNVHVNASVLTFRS